MDNTTIERLRDLVNVQGQSGNWNYDEYMHGMYNGMELMLATAEDREPIFKEKPEEWGRNKLVSAEEPTCESEE